MRASAKRSKASAKARLVKLGQRLGRGRGSPGPEDQPPSRSAQPCCADQRHEADRARDPPRSKSSSPVAGDLDQVLDRVRLADRHDQHAADRELPLQRLGHMAAARRARGSRRTAPPPAGRPSRRPRRSGHCHSRAAPSAPRPARRARHGARSRSPRRRSGPSPPPHSPSRRRSRAPCRRGATPAASIIRATI